MDNEQVKRDVLDFLKHNVIAVIATVSPENTPEAATIYYVVDNDFNFYFFSESNSRKVKNFVSNNKIALVVGTENTPVTAQIEGEVSTLDTGEEFKTKLEELQKVSHLSTYKPILERLANRPGGVVYKVKPSRIQWTDFREDSDEMRTPIVFTP